MTPVNRAFRIVPTANLPPRDTNDYHVTAGWRLIKEGMPRMFFASRSS